MSIVLGLAAAARSLLAAGCAAAEWRVDTTIAPPAGDETARARNSALLSDIVHVGLCVRQ
jgi:hypothetical protein